jgi:RHS repeat-associated protein
VSGSASEIQGFVATSFGYTNNRLVSRAPSAGDSFSYQYDNTGNQKIERQGTAQPPVDTVNDYDAASHPQKTTTPDGKWAAYSYDGLGRLATRRTDAGETTLFFHFGLVDQVAVEETTGGTPSSTTRYLLNSFGAPLGQVTDGTSSYFVPDLRGNLTQLLSPSDSGGNVDVKGIFAYDPYGKPKQDLDGSGDPTSDSLTNTASGADSRLRYQMAPHDPLTGNYNLGPRLLNPSINRFVGADFYAAGAANLALQVDPLTGNRYLYAGANPAGLIDDGHKCGSANSATVMTSTAVRIPVQKCPPKPASPSLEFPMEVLVARGPLVEINDPQPVGPFIESIPEKPKDPMSGYIITWEDPTLRGPYVESSAPKRPKRLLPPTNSPALPPQPGELPSGHSIRLGGPSANLPEYPYGYWRQYNAIGQAIDPSTGLYPKLPGGGNLTSQQFESMTHVPLPPTRIIEISELA